WNVTKVTWRPGRRTEGKDKEAKRAASEGRTLAMVIAVEELCWGDVGLYLSIPNPGLGGAAVAAAGTAEQKERFLSRFKGDKPTWGAMAITEPSPRPHSAAIPAP